MKAIKRLKTSVVSILVVILAISLGVGVFAGVAGHIYRIKMSYVQSFDLELAEDAEVKNTILMIGDGMGANHLKTAKTFYGIETLFMESFELDGLVSTFSKTGVTDSAAAATAMSTGFKIHNGGISMEQGNDLETLGEYALKHGKSVGIISTEPLHGATPSGFSAHSPGRTNSSKITKSQLGSGINLFMGAGKDYYASYEYDIESAGYDYVTSYEDLTYASDKIFASFNSIATSEGTDSEPELTELVEFAMDYLEGKSENGYFLMIEGAHIDKKSHGNDMSGMLKELKAFDEAVGKVAEKADNNTFVMVTADHETGNLMYNGETVNKINDSLFKSGGHTDKDVRYFATPQINNLPKKIDNTNIASIFRQLISG